MSAYKKITDLKVYVQELLNSGAPVCTAEKTARILACPGVPGEQVISWSVDAGGAAVKEKEAVVSTDASGHPDWIATKADASGSPVADCHAHLNQWIIGDSTFRRKYTAIPGHPDLYKPIGGPQHFVLLSEAIHIVQWRRMECGRRRVYQHHGSGGSLCHFRPGFFGHLSGHLTDPAIRRAVFRARPETLRFPALPHEQRKAGHHCA